MIIGDEGYIGSLLKQRMADSNDVVIYLAFMSNNDMCERNPHLAKRLNIDPFIAALEAAKGKRFVFASSVAAYGNCENATEETALNPTTLYGKQKKACEEILKASDLDYVIVRCASVCGVSPKMRYDLMVNRMVRDAAKHGRIHVNGGDQMRSHVHIEDVCRFYSWIMDNGESRETYNLVHSNASVRDTANLVAKTLGKTEVVALELTDSRSYTVNGDKLHNAGFECRSSIEEAIVSVYLNTLYG